MKQVLVYLSFKVSGRKKDTSKRRDEILFYTIQN